MPFLNETGASYACMTIQVVLIINHTQKIVATGQINVKSVKDYNYPLVHFYTHSVSFTIKRAEAESKMAVEYSMMLRMEIIPLGAELGPTKDIVFNVFKRRTCGTIGAVLGWPTWDHPSVAGGEGLSWVNEINGASYRALNISLPRRKRIYGQWRDIDAPMGSLWQ